MRSVLYIFLFILYTTTSLAQVKSIDSSDVINDILTLKVKQLDEFIGLFNNDDNLWANKQTNYDLPTERRGRLAFLLNHADSTLYNTTTEEFINYTCRESNNSMLNFTDDNWYAKLICSVKYENKTQDISLVLKVEGNNEDGYRWIIRGVDAPFIDMPLMKYDTVKFIGPINHELDFIDLFKVFEDHENISQYANKDFEFDGLSIFFFLIKTEKLQYKKVKSIQYQFLQIKDWIFTVENFNRMWSNSGWLISSVLKISDTEKTDYKKKNLYLRNE